MTSTDKELLIALRRAAESEADPTKRAELLSKLGSLQKSLEEIERLEHNSPDPDQVLAQAKKNIALARLVLGAFAVGLLGTVAWFMANSLRLI